MAQAAAALAAAGGDAEADADGGADDDVGSEARSTIVRPSYVGGNGSDLGAGGADLSDLLFDPDDDELDGGGSGGAGAAADRSLLLARLAEARSISTSKEWRVA